MAITSYSDLKTTIGVWLERSDASDPITTYIDDFIDLAEERLARDVRIWGNEKALSGTLSGGVVSVPTDFVELKHAYIDGDPVYPLDQREAWWIYREYSTRSSDSKPHFIAIDGGNFIFGPYPDSDYTLAGTYYFKPTALSDSNTTSEWTTYAPDLLLWACLVETAPFLKEDERSLIWESKYQARLKEVNRQDKRKIRRNARVMHMPSWPR